MAVMYEPSLFVGMIFERAPQTLADLPADFLTWVRIVGVFAFLGVLVWVLVGYPRLRPEERAQIPSRVRSLFTLALLGAGIGYLIGIPLLVVTVLRSAKVGLWVTIPLDIGGACALFAVLLPVGRNLSSLRIRRIYALAKLSFKEAIRRRVLYVCSAILLIFLFASWFITSEPKDQVRTYVEVVFWGMTALLLLPSVIIASFSLPTDIRQQTIHTIVTKPVERFEIVLGRFLGFFALMSLVLLLMTVVSVLYIFREVNPEAAEESLKARVPLYGEVLRFEGTGDRNKGINVGREWDYRSHISGRRRASDPIQYAIWEFPEIPATLTGRDEVLCEFTFDIFRTTKGEENQGVDCDFFFSSWKCADRTLDELDKLPPAEQKKLGYFHVYSKLITDYHTQNVTVPGWVFAVAGDDNRPETENALQVRVMNNHGTQYVGMAKHDLFFRLDQHRGAHRAMFAYNFLKASIGLWLLLGLVTGVAVSLSTYLGGVLAFMVTMLLYAGGWSREFIQSIALGKNAGGGPFEAVLRMARRDVGVAPLPESTSRDLAQLSDHIFQVFTQVILWIVPDIDQLDLTSFVAEGFHIGPDQLLIKGLYLLGYLLPWVILGYYLLRWREIAGPT